MTRKIIFAWLGLAALLCGCAAPGGPSGAAPDAGLSATARADLYLSVVDGLIRQRRFEAAIAFLAQYQKTRRPTARFELLSGEALTGAGRYDEAIACYAAALKMGLAAPALDGMGRAEAGRDRWAAAADRFRRAAALSPASADYLNNYAYARIAAGRRGPALGTAVTALMRAHELDPGSQIIRNNLVLAAALSGDRVQVSTLLDTIPDARRRKMVAGFAQSWTARKGNGP